MADPTPYVRGYSFTGFQASNPTKPTPGDQHDNEFNGIQAAIDSVVTGLKDIRRSDGKLKNGIVTRESLDPKLSLGFQPRGVWQAATLYAADDTAFNGTGFYVAIEDHVSAASFATDLAAERWALIADFADVIGTTAWEDITGVPATFTPSGHTHVAADLSDATVSAKALMTAADFAKALRQGAQFTTGRVFQAEDHGVVADYNPGTNTGSDNKAALDALIALTQEGDTIFIGSGPNSYIGWSGTVKLKDRTALIGRGHWSNIVRMTTQGNGVAFLDIAIETRVEHLYAWARPGTTGGGAFQRVATAISGVNGAPENNRLTHCRVTRFDNTGYFYAGIVLDAINGAMNYGSRDCVLTDCLVTSYTGYGIRLASCNNPRLIGVDLVRPEDVPPLNPNPVYDLWVTGTAPNLVNQGGPTNDLEIEASTLDNVVLERTSLASIKAGVIGTLWVDATCASVDIHAAAINGAITNNCPTARIRSGRTEISDPVFAFGFTASDDCQFDDNILINNPIANTDNKGRIIFREVNATRFVNFVSYANSDRYYIADQDESHGVYLAQNASTWTGFSDERLKADVRVVSVLDQIEANPDVDYFNEFTWKHDGTPDVGVLAQQLYKVLPHLVRPGTDDGKKALPKGAGMTSPEAWGVETAQAGLAALQAVKELLERVQELEARAGVRRRKPKSQKASAKLLKAKLPMKKPKAPVTVPAKAEKAPRTAKEFMRKHAVPGHRIDTEMVKRQYARILASKEANRG